MAAAIEFVRFHPYTIRLVMKGRAGDLAKLLTTLEAEVQKGSPLANLAFEMALPAMPRYVLTPAGTFIFEAYVPETNTAEQAYAELVEELERFGFEPDGPP